MTNTYNQPLDYKPTLTLYNPCNEDGIEIWDNRLIPNELYYRTVSINEKGFISTITPKYVQKKLESGYIPALTLGAYLDLVEKVFGDTVEGENLTRIDWWKTNQSRLVDLTIQYLGEIDGRIINIK